MGAIVARAIEQKVGANDASRVSEKCTVFVLKNTFPHKRHTVMQTTLALKTKGVERSSVGLVIDGVKVSIDAPNSSL